MPKAWEYSRLMYYTKKYTNVLFFVSTNPLLEFLPLSGQDTAAQEKVLCRSVCNVLSAAELGKEVSLLLLIKSTCLLKPRSFWQDQLKESKCVQSNGQISGPQNICGVVGGWGMGSDVGRGRNGWAIRSGSRTKPLWPSPMQRVYLNQDPS